MITPNIRQDLQIFPGTAMEDGSPSWMLYDGLTNKYFTLGLNAFRMLKHWIAGVESKLFIEEIEKKEALEKYGSEGSGKNLPFSSLSEDLKKKEEEKE